MKNTSDSKSHRRKFLSLSLLGGAALVSQPASAIHLLDPDHEIVPMLTADGKVVGVNKKVLDQIRDRKQASMNHE